MNQEPPTKVEMIKEPPNLTKVKEAKAPINPKDRKLILSNLSNTQKDLKISVLDPNHQQLFQRQEHAEFSPTSTLSHLDLTSVSTIIT